MSVGIGEPIANTTRLEDLESPKRHSFHLPQRSPQILQALFKSYEETRFSQNDPVAICYQEVEDGDDVLGVDGLDGPLLLTPLEAQHLVGETQDDPQLVALTLLRLGHLWNLELLTG